MSKFIINLNQNIICSLNCGGKSMKEFKNRPNHHKIIIQPPKTANTFVYGYIEFTEYILIYCLSCVSRINIRSL